ncbi:cytochrome P450 [Trichoderma camerunense]
MLLGVYALLFVLLTIYIANKVYLSPLSKIPASHWSARFSPIWSLWVRYRGTELSELVKAHRKHGPIVQVGPHDISISSYQGGIRKVYDAGFGKPSQFYSFFNYYGNQNAFTSLDGRAHGLRRRRSAALYSKAALMESHQMHNISIKIMYTDLYPLLKSAAASGVQADALDISYRLCSDYISSFLLGYGNGTAYLSKEQKYINEWRFHYDNYSCHECFFPQEMPFLYNILKNVGIDLLPRSYWTSKKFLETWLRKMESKADETIRQRSKMKHSIPPENQPVVYETIKLAVKKDSPHLDEQTQQAEIGSEMFDHISASREVLGLVLSYTFWHLAQNPHAQRRVREELIEAGIDLTSAPKLADYSTDLSTALPVALGKLKFLEAVIQESLRMRPTSTPLPRITPSDRAVSIAGIDNIPPNTRVNAFQWFVHRDPTKWDRVDEWIPERWLGREHVSQKDRREDVLWALASGPRICLGSNWTYYAMRYIIAVTCFNFEFEALSGKPRNCWPGSSQDLLPIKIKSLIASENEDIKREIA